MLNLKKIIIFVFLLITFGLAGGFIFAQEECPIPASLPLPKQAENPEQCLVPVPPLPTPPASDGQPPQVWLTQTQGVLTGPVISVFFGASDEGRGDSNIWAGELQISTDNGTSWTTFGYFPFEPTESAVYAESFNYNIPLDQECRYIKFRYRAEDEGKGRTCFIPKELPLPKQVENPEACIIPSSLPLPKQAEDPEACSLPPGSPDDYISLENRSRVTRIARWINAELYQKLFLIKVSLAQEPTHQWSGWAEDGAAYYDGTIPQVTNPSPSNEATNIDIDITLSWSGSDNCGGAVTYDVYFGIDPDPPFITTQTANSFDPGSLEYETVYYWKIVAQDEVGNESSGDIWKFTTTMNKPSAFDNLDLAAQSCSSVSLSWDCSNKADEYAVYRNGVEIGIHQNSDCHCDFPSGEQCSWTDTGLAENTEYSYHIQARNAAGQTNNSDPPGCENSAGETANICSKSTITPFCPPDPPENLNLDGSKCGEISLSWNTIPEVDGYNLYRASNETGPFALITNTTLTSYSDEKIIARVDYYYYLTAFGVGGESNPSSTVKGSSFCFKGPKWREK